ncbi:MAG TPA: carbon-nitrogen hydrolase family protein [Caulobacter sp.]|nr:carbon-nitrogen hydrolase family protein [Caulobacter sp.]
MRPIGIAGLQLQLDRGDNGDRIAAEVAAVKARLPWVDMVVLGELALFGAAVANAQPLPGEAEARMCEAARAAGVWLVPGSLFEADGGRVYNTAPVIDPSGQVVARYRKIYPFLPYEQGVTPGNEFVVFDVPAVGRFGLSICYDMWFPETTRTLTWMGAEVILHPGMTNTIDREAELAIARASAVTNQVFFVDINTAGSLGVGLSGVFGPGGEVIHQAGAGHEVIAVELDLDQVTRVRERGWHGLGQPLKSLRDHPIDFPPYREGFAASPAFSGLGPLQKPGLARPASPGLRVIKT